MSEKEFPSVAQVELWIWVCGQSLQMLKAFLMRLDDVWAHRVSERFRNDLESDTMASRNPASAGRFRGEIELRNVTFGYARALEPLFKDLSLKVRPGGRVALVGASGAGKTTVGNLVGGLYQAWSGEVLIDGEPIEVATDVGRIMDPKRPGDVVTLGVEPPDRSEVRTVEITLGPAPDEPDRGIIGIQLQPRDPDYQYPFPIDIDSGNVGGPSAGLAFSLAIIDVLTPGELTGGKQVAVTGTIDGNGNVGPVGGVAQKTAVVSDAGYDVFLVPSGEVDDVRARAGGDLEVIPVDTLEDALDALASLGGSGFETAAAPG